MSGATPTPQTTDSRRERGRGIETRLWRVVIQRAIIDAFAKPGKGGATARETVEAREWLAEGEGEGDLHLVAEFASIDGGMIQSWALEMQAQGWPRSRYEVYRQIARGLENERKQHDGRTAAIRNGNPTAGHEATRPGRGQTFDPRNLRHGLALPRQTRRLPQPGIDSGVDEKAGRPLGARDRPLTPKESSMTDKIEAVTGPS